MKTLLLIPLLLAWVQDDTAELNKKAHELIGKLPDAAAHAALVKMGKPILPYLVRIESSPRIDWANTETPRALHAVIVEIRGWKDPAVQLGLKREYQMSFAKSLVIRDRETADKYFVDFDTAFPKFDFTKEMALFIMPGQINQAIEVTGVVRSDEKKTLTVEYALKTQPDCGRNFRSTTARAISLPTTEYEVVFKPAKE